MAELTNIVLLGFMGTGKSSVGRELADRLQLEFVDIDEDIVGKCGCSIPDLFEEKGEETFREIESDSIRYWSSRNSVVISCGGGAVTNPENLELLSENGTLICLTANADTVLARVGADTNRPLLKAPDRKERIQKLLEERAPLYEQIKHRVCTDNKTLDQVVDEVLKILP